MVSPRAHRPACSVPLCDSNGQCVMMTEYYSGPNNADPLIGIVITLCVVTGMLGIWRFAYRHSKGVLGLSDYLLMLGLV